MKKVLFLLVFISVFANVSIAEELKTNYRNALIFAYSRANSIYEDDNIILEIYNESLWATNKTQKTLFIDLSQCFQVHNGSSHPMFSEKQNEKKASKKGVTTSIDEFITIAPATGSKQNATWICDLSVGIYHTYGTSEGTDTEFSEYDMRLLRLINDLLEGASKKDSKKKEYLGTTTKHLTEDESINNIGASIAYAFNKRAEEWNSVSISTWVCDVIFAPFYVEFPKDLKGKEKKGFGIKETKPAVIHVKADSPFEFESDKSPITVCDWEGNYKEGTFVLSNPLTIKKKVNFFKLATTNWWDLAKGNYIDKTNYKRIVSFDGSKVNWGEMTYTNNPSNTKQVDKSKNQDDTE